MNVGRGPQASRTHSVGRGRLPVGFACFKLSTWYPFRVVVVLVRENLISCQSFAILIKFSKLVLTALKFFFASLLFPTLRVCVYVIVVKVLVACASCFPFSIFHFTVSLFHSQLPFALASGLEVIQIGNFVGRRAKLFNCLRNAAQVAKKCTARNYCCVFLYKLN